MSSTETLLVAGWIHDFFLTKIDLVNFGMGMEDDVTSLVTFRLIFQIEDLSFREFNHIFLIFVGLRSGFSDMLKMEMVG